MKSFAHDLKRKCYLDAQRWRCESSPTGAHHWHIAQLGHGICQHCRKRRKFKGDYRMVQPNPGIEE